MLLTFDYHSIWESFGLNYAFYDVHPSQFASKLVCMSNKPRVLAVVCVAVAIKYLIVVDVPNIKPKINHLNM